MKVVLNAQLLMLLTVALRLRLSCNESFVYWVLIM